MMLLRGPRPWRPRRTPTPSIPGRARPPMPQVRQPERERGPRRQGRQLEKFAGDASAGGKASGHEVHFFSARGRSRQWSPGRRHGAGADDRRGQGRGDLRAITRARLGCGDPGAAAGEQQKYSGRRFLRVRRRRGGSFQSRCASSWVVCGPGAPGNNAGAERRAVPILRTASPSSTLKREEKLAFCSESRAG